MGSGMDDERTKRRDEINSVILAVVGLIILLSFGVWHWSSGFAVHNRSGEPEPLLRCDLNALSIEEIQTLPGVGAATARRIVEHRTQVGGFKTIEQLSEVPGIGPGRVSRLRPFLFISGEIDSSDRKDVPTNERPISVASSVSTGGRSAKGH